MQMASAARLASAFPQVGGQLRRPLPGRAARRVPGHRPRAAGGAVVAVRRRRRRRPGADRRRRPDSVDLRLARRVGDQPAAVHHRLSRVRTAARRPRWSCAPAGAIRRGRCIWPTRCPPRPGAARWRCGRCGRGPTREPGDDPVRTTERRCGRTRLGGRPFGADATTTPASDGSAAPTAAVLVRRNADAAPMADALAARGVPVEVVGLAGSARRPRGRRRGGDAAPGRRSQRRRGRDAGAHRAAVAAGWPRHLRAVAARRRTRRRRRAVRRAIGRRDRCAGRRRRRHRVPGRRDQRSGACRCVFAGGHGRIAALGRELTALRAHLAHPLPDLVAEVRRVLGVDAEVRAARPPSAGWRGTEHLDAFADVVADFAARGPVRRCRICSPIWTPPSRWRTGSGARRGDRRARPRADPDRARGQGAGVAGGGRAAPERTGVPVDGVDADVAHRRGRPAAAAARRPRHRLGAHGVPVLDTSDVNDRKRLSDKISEHKRRLDQRRVDEERRLLYVALTRAEDTLLLSGHHWGASEAKPRGPSEFLCELKEIIERPRPPPVSRAAWSNTGRPRLPTVSRTRCATRLIEAVWPADPAGARRGDVDRGAALVAPRDDGRARDAADGRRRLGRRRRRAARRARPRAPQRPRRRCPRSCRSAAWWNSAATPTPRRNGCAAGCRRGPTRMPCWAPHFTTGCSGSTAPSGCSTSTTCPARSTGSWRATTRRARRTAGRVRGVAVGGAHPVDVEVPFDMVIGGTGGAGPHRRGLRRR